MFFFVSASFKRGNNPCDFLFASVDMEALPKWGLLKVHVFFPREQILAIKSSLPL